MTPLPFPINSLHCDAPNEASLQKMAIGIFDSGVGGLTVFKSLSETFPQTSIIYFGDTARFPYGTKSEATVARYAIENTQFLIDQGAKAIVVACNTATASALPQLQEKFSIPIVGVIEGAAQRAVEISTNGRIGVIGTSRTVKSGSYQKAILQRMQEAEVFSYACPLLVAAIEDGALPQQIVQSILAHYLRPLKRLKIDTLILGCTHYPLMRTQIELEMGEQVQIIDPAQLCAKSLISHIHDVDGSSPEYRFFVSDDPPRFRKLGQLFLKEKMGKVVYIHKLVERS